MLSIFPVPRHAGLLRLAKQHTSFRFLHNIAQDYGIVLNVMHVVLLLFLSLRKRFSFCEAPPLRRRSQLV